ncbi:adenylate/guanylate cyclase domain-containing protein, partial [Kitasatospora sp. LaBMicrA B282]|uniref:adenylate/guanylate cyclase domain-containing protein n=1 Tax=Kitasatospora sp. LaBMicrA B282 TaxID=3420949 RepID=UPI003D0A3876
MTDRPPTCPGCGADLPTGARFCAHCGVPTGDAEAAEERRVVTVLFCDLVDSTRLSGLLDVELLRTILLRYYALMRQRIEAHGGIVEKFIGDAVMAVFGLTATREDDAHRALAAALELHAALDGLNAELEREHRVRLRIRIGVHTGEAVTTVDPARRQALVSGEVVNIAARLQAAAEPGGVLLSLRTWRAAGPGPSVERIGALRLKGVAQPVEAGRLLGLGGADAEQARRFDVPFVGRERYLGELDLAWRRVAEECDVHVLTLLGEAGIGKSRLVDEWLRRAGPASDSPASDSPADGRPAGTGQAGLGPVGIGRCRAAGTEGPLHALVGCLEPLVAEPPEDARTAAAIALLRGGLLLDGAPAPSVDATCAAIARLLTERSAAHPLLLVLDDLHNAEQPLLDLLERLVDEVRRLPILLLCLARPDLVDTCPGWGTGLANATTVTLTGLAPADSAVLAAHLVDLALHAGAAAEQIVAQADGNPLYLEQLAATVEETGSVQQLPPTLHALLAARIDRLAEAERRALRHAAVVGREFEAADLAELAGAAGTGEAGEAEQAAVLRTLTRRGLIQPVRRTTRTGAVHCFVNGITQRVAYEGLTKQRRGELHQRYAEFLLAAGHPDAAVGAHLEQAHRYRAAVGRLDATTAALRERAVRHLVRAGTAALRRVDLPRALALLQRAAELTEPGDPGRPELWQHLGEVHLTMGERAAAYRALTLAVTEAEAAGEPGVAAHARLHLAAARDPRALEQAATEALPVFAATGDRLGLARG